MQIKLYFDAGAAETVCSGHLREPGLQLLVEDYVGKCGIKSRVSNSDHYQPRGHQSFLSCGAGFKPAEL